MQKKYTRLPYIICYLSAFVIGMKQLREPDIWWQLLTGRWMLDNGEITRTDMFSYTMNGTEWVNVKWLYEVVIAFLEKGLGPHGVMLLQASVNVAIVYLLLRVVYLFAKQAASQVSTLYTSIAVVLFLLASEFRMAGRPEMVSHLLTVVYMFVLWKAPGYNWKRILWLVPLQCMWANMHEGYPVGMVIIGLYIAGGALSYMLSKNKEYLAATGRLAVIWAGMALAILLNPNGLQLWKQPFEIFRQLRANKYTSELFSIAEPEYWTVHAKINAVLFVAVLLFWLLRLVMNKTAERKLTFSPQMVGYLLSIPVFGYLSFTALRNVPFTAIVLFPSVPIMLAWSVQKVKLTDKDFYKKLAKRTAIISTVVVAALYISIVSNAYYKFTNVPDRYGLHLNTLRNPTSAAAFIKEYDLKGPAFSDYFVSSYLLWDLYPDFKSFIDLRDLDVFPQKFFDDYFDLYNKPKKFYDLDSTYKFNYIVISTAQLNSLQQELYWGEGFNVVHVDPVCMILLRQTDENIHINQGPAARQLFTWPQDPLDPAWAVTLSKLFNPDVSYDKEDMKYMPIHAGKFYNMVRNSRIAIRFLRPAVMTDFSEDADALAATGNAYLGYANFTEKREEQHVRLDSAGIFFEKALAIDAKEKDALLGMAGIMFSRKQFVESMKLLERYLDIEQNNDYVYYLNGLSAWNLYGTDNSRDNADKVIENMHRSTELNENNKKGYLYMADMYNKLGEKEKARESIRQTTGDIPWMGYEKKLLATLKEELGIEDADVSEELRKTLETP